MDTDDLSVQTYNGNITESEKFHHDSAKRQWMNGCMKNVKHI